MSNIQILQAQRDELNTLIINHPDYVAPVKTNSSAYIFKKLQKCKFNTRNAFKYNYLQNMYLEALKCEGK